MASLFPGLTRAQPDRSRAPPRPRSHRSTAGTVGIGHDAGVRPRRRPGRRTRWCAGCGRTRRRSSPRCPRWPPRPARSTWVRASRTPTARRRCWRRPGRPSPTASTSTRPARASRRCGRPSRSARLRDHGQRFDPDTEVLVTVGATEALAAAVLGLCEPGDEVLMLEPHYDSYPPIVAMAGGTPPVGAAAAGRDRPVRPRRRRTGRRGRPAHPDADPEHPAQPDRHGAHPGGTGRDRRGGHRARPDRADRRGLRVPGLRRRRAPAAGHVRRDGRADASPSPAPARPSTRPVGRSAGPAGRRR